jgi:hypothetical protein
MRKCRFCAKEIQDAARVCEHCGRELFPGRTPAPIEAAPAIVVPPPAVVAPLTTKTCPFCAEEIQAAAIVCKHCGRDLLASPATPAIPVATPPRPTSGLAQIVAVVVGVVFLIILVNAVGSTNGSSASSKTLNVTVRHGMGAVEITNAGSGEAVGQDLIVYLNGDPPFTYKATATVPLLGQSVRMPLYTFTQKDGTRFNPITTAVTVIWVGGGGYDYRSFGK